MKLLARILEKLLGQRHGGDAPELDMYLPNRLLAIAMILFVIGVGLAIAGSLTVNIFMILGALVCVPLGVTAWLCWKNQSIRMITTGKFEYTTFLGNTYTYNFSDITGLRKNQDSLTLFVAGKKVHIESMAYLSNRLIKAINEALEAHANK